MSKAYASDVIKIAKDQVGYLEKKSNKDLDSFTANAGTGNYTKYARDYALFTGTNYQGQAWCDQFVDWVFFQAYGKDKACELLGGFSAYTPTSANYFKKMNRWYTSSPEVGDIIFFKNSERICHTGIVSKIDDTYVYTIEGNTSDGEEVIPNGGAVCEKSYKLNNTRIAGYGRPNYDVYIPIFTITKDSSDEDIAWLQTKLNLALKDVVEDFVELIVDSNYGNKTKATVIKFYELQGWKTDGLSVGKYAIGRLNNY